MNKSRIIELLKAIYAAELEAAESYLAGSVWLEGPGAQQVAESLDSFAAQELSHAKKIALRLKRLGVRAPDSLQTERTREVGPPRDATDLLSAVEAVLEVEQGAIARYESLIGASAGRDHETHELAIEILAEEERHRALFEGFFTSLSEQRKTKPLKL
ncbi:MAG: ferritin-like domain-containing protein [Verrucomicrobiota bacterium]|jgi:bacterioferritin